jgi:large subunit ribosomal protein L3
VKFILGKKIDMTQKFTEKGVVPVTVVQAGPCTITQVKSASGKEGYDAVQVGYGDRKKPQSKSVAGHLKGLSNFRYLREFRVEADKESTELKKGQTVSVEQFKVGDVVNVSGISKGKGFQGVVKRHGFHGSPKSHGHKDQLRMPGSIGVGGIQKVMKGMKMGGQMGAQQVTTRNLEIAEVDAEHNKLFIKGSVPGARNTLIVITGEGELVIDSAQEKNVKESTPEKPQNETLEELSKDEQPTLGAKKDNEKKSEVKSAKPAELNTVKKNETSEKSKNNSEQ